MKLYQPHSFFALLLTSFCFVCLPLLTALYTSVQILDNLAEKSVDAVHNSVDRVAGSRKVVELLQDEERVARVYHVLGDPEQLAEANRIHREIQDKLQDLSAANSAPEVDLLITALAAEEKAIVAILNRPSAEHERNSSELEQALLRYQSIGGMTASLIAAGNKLMRSEVEELKIRADEDKKKLAWQTSALISFTVLITIVFMILIFRPVRQIDRGIERMGDGNFSTPITVTGPRDLELLGNKLDWLRKRLATLDQEKSKMIAHISHDLKTPLASIKEGAGLLRDELVGPLSDKQKEVIGILDKNCSRLQVLIERILDFNMAQARQIPIEKSAIRLEDLVSEVVTDHRNSILARNIKLDMKLESAAVFGNRKQLRAIFDNLLSNAVKFTPDRGIIRLRLKPEGKVAVFLIEDSGLGIDEGERPAIFSPFFQGKGVERAVVKGSGLGLAISREYAQNHGGTIRLLPSRQGARFEVKLPLAGGV